MSHGSVKSIYRQRGNYNSSSTPYENRQAHARERESGKKQDGIRF